jgi:uncharacterized protein (TIGR02646 family)
MIAVTLPESVLNSSTRNSLLAKQNRINSALLTWDQRVDQAETNWKNWRRTLAARDVKKNLLSASAGIGLCCYCEHDRAVQIDHVFNKKLYPNRCFTFANHVLVCGECNKLKLDAFAVFDDDTSLAVTYYNKGGTRFQPASSRSVFIDPRSDDPMDFFMLDLETGVIKIHPLADPRGTVRAEYTLGLLQLNSSHELVDRRKSAVDQYLHFIQKYIGCRDASSLTGLESFLPATRERLSPFTNLSFAKQAGQDHWVDEIRKTHFPTIWQEMKRQYKTNPTTFARLYPKIAQALAAVPELL